MTIQVARLVVQEAEALPRHRLALAKKVEILITTLDMQGDSQRAIFEATPDILLLLEEIIQISVTRPLNLQRK